MLKQFKEAIEKGYIDSYNETSIIYAIYIVFNNIFDKLVETIDLKTTGEMYNYPELEVDIHTLKSLLDQYIHRFIIKEEQWIYDDKNLDEIWSDKNILEKEIFHLLSKTFRFLSV